MINKNKKLLLKFILASFVISAMAVILGFFGTHLILNSQEKRFENHFVPEAIRTIELIHRKTNIPITEVVEEYNNFSQYSQGAEGPGRKRRPPMNVTVITKESAKFALPNEVGTFTELPGKISDVKMFKDQVYNYDGTHYLVFRFNPGPPPEMRFGPGGPGGPGGPRGDMAFDRKGPPPPIFMVPLILTFVIILFVITTSSLLVLYFLRRQAAKAGEVLRALKSGDMQARFPITKIDEASELMLEFNQMADEIEKLVVDLRDIDHLRRKLLQELAHDLRTPVASMKSLLEGLLYQGDKMSKELREENLQLSLKEVDYFHHLVEDLLFLSGVHDLKYRGKFSVIDMTDIIQHEVQVVNETNKKVKVNFIFEDYFLIRADQHLFTRLMKNALSNAINNAEKSVVVKLYKEESNIVLDVTNDGHGLTPEDIQTFGKKRATRRINDNTEGRISVGLGAVIMAKICELHSTEMKISNNADDLKSGATLKFKFNDLDI